MNRRFQNEKRGSINRLASSSNGQEVATASQTDWSEQSQRLSATLVEKVESTIQARPLTCLGIAAGLGILAAFWSKRK